MTGRGRCSSSTTLQDVLAKAMANPDHVKKMEDAGLTIKVMVGEGVREILPRRPREGRQVHGVGAQQAAPLSSRSLSQQVGRCTILSPSTSTLMPGGNTTSTK